MYGIDFESSELCLIDSGIQSLKTIPLGRQLCVLNLHNNDISRIECLDKLHNLKHLDLSSNRIDKIEGLGSLQTLRTLNLSCNRIKVMEGLQNLRSLVKLNLSYNQIDDVSGFASLWGSGYKLSHIDLHDNNLINISTLVQCLSGCVSVVSLTLCQGTSSNPLCNHKDYRAVVFRGLPQLQKLDGVGRDGQLADSTELLTDIPGLESYLEYLLSTNSTTEETSSAHLVTPKIDQALDRFRNRGMSSTEVSSLTAGEDMNSEASELTTRGRSATPQTGIEDTSRLAVLEAQLAQLMAAHKVPGVNGTSSESLTNEKPNKASVSRMKAERESKAGQTDDSESEAGAKPHKSRSKQSNLRRKTSNQTTYRQQTKSSQAKTNTPSSSSDAHQTGYRSKSPSPARQSFTPHTVSVGTESTAHSVKPTTDRLAREDVQSTYLSLMKELESERERRWKAEQAAMKLVDHVKDLQLKAQNETSLQETSAQVNMKLKQVLTNEKEAKLRLRDELEAAKDQVKALNEQLHMSQEAEHSQRRALQAMEQTVGRAESERLKQQAHEAKKVQEAQMRASASSREADILKNTVTTLKGQVHQLQELLATREQEFRQEMKGRYTLDSTNLQEVIEKEVKKVEKVHAAEQKSQQEKIDILSKQYKDLEDEFRLALQIEANRFQELQSAFEQTSRENAANKQALLTAQKKEERSASMLSELTALVKEQKGRITELSRFKQEQTVDYKERIHTLETHVEEAKKRMLQMELLKQEKSKLEATVQAQESVIEGLRSERKLWGQELAQQGASLAQDRGRLEAQIETLQSELVMAKKHLEREADSVKIKTKMLEDQTETIRKLKQAVVEREEEVKKCREEGLSIQRQLESQLEEEKSNSQDLQDSVDQLKTRKDELKHQLTELETDLDESKRAHSILNKRWKDKSDLIGQLEQQVHQMKDTWEGKETKLIKERDEAVERASVAIEKLRSIDDAFRQQLDAKEQQHREKIEQLEREKQIEISEAQQKLISVENEMRLLLQETEANKRGMEEKVKKLTRAFTDLQEGLG